MPVYSIDHLPGRTVRLQGKEYLYFSGTAYLGLAHHPDFQQYLAEGLQRYGANYGSSRLSNVRLQIFDEAEQYLAQWLGLEAVLTVSSGSLAGQLLVKYLQQRATCYFSPVIHPALSGERVPFSGTLEEWQKWVIQQIPPDTQQPTYLLTSSVDALHAGKFDWSWLNALSKERQYVLVVDDSHGFGILGPTGQGIIAELPRLANVEYIIVGSTGKALGIPGGLIAGSRELIRSLWESPFFGGASPVIPAYLYAFLKAKELIQRQRQHLLATIRYFSAGIGSFPLQTFTDYPVFYSNEQQLAERLFEKGIVISSFPYPTPHSPLLNRIVLTAAHTKQDLDSLLEGIRGMR